MPRGRRHERTRLGLSHRTRCPSLLGRAEQACRKGREMTKPTDGVSQGPAIERSSEWESKLHHIEGSLFYIRIDTGPNHEEALLCVDDGEPDTCDLARFNSLK